MGQNPFPKFKIDAELGLLGPLHQRLYMEDPSANNYNDTNMMRASGEEFSNFSWNRPGEALLKCRNACKSMFNKESEGTLREACISTCKSSCTIFKCKSTPTRSSVCLGRNLNADCTEKIAPTIDVATPLNVTASKGVASDSGSQSGSSAKTSSKALMIGGGILGIALLGFIAFKAFKK